MRLDCVDGTRSRIAPGGRHVLVLQPYVNTTCFPEDEAHKSDLTSTLGVIRLVDRDNICP
jgi:hypothetical protein